MKIHENREVHFRGTLSLFLFLLVLISAGCTSIYPGELSSCVKYAWRFQRPVADEAATRFLGKVREETARCRGGEDAVALRPLPWVDWQNYWGAGDADSRSYGPAGWVIGHLFPNGRGIDEIGRASCRETWRYG